MSKKSDEIKEIADELDRVQSEISGVQPILISIQDSGDPDLDILDAVGGLMGYCANSIGDIRARLDKLADA